MNDDATLLRRYAEDGSEAAFTELVQRHVDLVYSAAQRRLGGDPHRAADVAQRVFTTLAREAPRLARHTMLSARLHTATRNAAITLTTSEQRRQVRELEAFKTAPLMTSDETGADWDRVRPVLDAAIDELPETDRAAVVARFFERKPFAELGAALNLSEDAARMRTERSLEKLRGVLARRGITSTAIALEALVTSQAVGAAPAGLGAKFTLQALAATGAVTGAATLTSFLTIMNAKIITATALTAAAALGLGFYLGVDRGRSERLPPMPETPQQIQMIASLHQENLRLKADVERLKLEKDKLTAAPRATPPPAPRVIVAAPQVAPSQMALSQQERAVLAVRDAFVKASEAYAAAHQGAGPPTLESLIPFFPTAQEGADFVEFMEAAKAASKELK